MNESNFHWHTNLFSRLQLNCKANQVWIQNDVYPERMASFPVVLLFQLMNIWEYSQQITCVLSACKWKQFRCIWHFQETPIVAVTLAWCPFSSTPLLDVFRRDKTIYCWQNIVKTKPQHENYFSGILTVLSPKRLAWPIVFRTTYFLNKASCLSIVTSCWVCKFWRNQVRESTTPRFVLSEEDSYRVVLQIERALQITDLTVFGTKLQITRKSEIESAGQVCLLEWNIRVRTFPPRDPPTNQHDKQWWGVVGWKERGLRVPRLLLGTTRCKGGGTLLRGHREQYCGKCCQENRTEQDAVHATKEMGGPMLFTLKRQEKNSVPFPTGSQFPCQTVSTAFFVPMVTHKSL